jgi:glycolate oxidase FAD binding subunit
MTTSLAVSEKFEAIVGAPNVCVATAADAVAGVQPEYIVSPGNQQELAAILACANEAGLAVLPRGGGTKLDWGKPPQRAAIVLSTLRLNRVLEHAWADLTVVVEAGCTMQALQDTLARHGQRLALDVLWPTRATVGGVLSTNDSGALRLRFGALRDLIIGMTLGLPDGTSARSGGKVVKNVAGYDLPKLATGALGTLGVITRAIFRLHSLPWTATTITCRTDQIPKAQLLLKHLLASNLSCSAIQTRFLADKESEVSTDILFEGTAAGLSSQIAQVQSLAGPVSFSYTDPSVWQFREQLYSGAKSSPVNSTLVKISALPVEAITLMADMQGLLGGKAKVDATIQATGLGTLLLQGDADTIPSVLAGFRKKLESTGGSLVVLGNSLTAKGIDPWGTPGDAFELMRSVKKQFDPKNTLNPGRFVGGI